MNALLEKLKPYFLPALLAVLVVAVWLKPNNASLAGAVHQLEFFIQQQQEILETSSKSIAARSFPSPNTSLQWFVYDNRDSLIFYTSNEIQPPTLDKTSKGNQVVLVRNGWYFMQWEKESGQTIIGLTRIKNEFRFENKFLQNEFVPALPIPANYTISETELKGALAVHNREGKTLFWIYADETKAVRQSNLSLVFMYFLHFQRNTTAYS